MTIEKKILEEKKEFAMDFGDWLQSMCKDVGNGNWEYRMDKELYSTYEIIDIFLEGRENI
jgi:hypothetical protein